MAKQPRLDERGYRKFGAVDKLAYAAGDFGCNMSFALKGTLALFWTQFMLVDEVMTTYAPNMGATVDRANVFLNYSGCYAEATISPDGKVVKYYTKVNANMVLKDAKVKIVNTDLDVILYSDTEYTDIQW